MSSEEARQAKIQEFRREIFTPDQVRRLDEVDRTVADEKKKEEEEMLSLLQFFNSFGHAFQFINILFRGWRRLLRKKDVDQVLCRWRIIAHGRSPVRLLLRLNYSL
jgi:hypothetical protein